MTAADDEAGLDALASAGLAVFAASVVVVLDFVFVCGIAGVVFFAGDAAFEGVVVETGALLVAGFAAGFFTAPAGAFATGAALAGAAFTGALAGADFFGVVFGAGDFAGIAFFAGTAGFAAFAGLAGVTFFATLATGFFAGDGFAAGFFAGAGLATGFFAAGLATFFATGLFAAGLEATGFFAAAFATGFLAALAAFFAGFFAATCVTSSFP